MTAAADAITSMNMQRIVIHCTEYLHCAGKNEEAEVSKTMRGDSCLSEWVSECVVWHEAHMLVPIVMCIHSSNLYQ